MNFAGTKLLSYITYFVLHCITYLGYGDVVYDQVNNAAFCQKLESLNHFFPTAHTITIKQIIPYKKNNLS